MEEPRSSGTNAKRRTRKIQKHLWFSDADWDVVARRMRASEQTNFSKFAREILTTGLISIPQTRSDAEIISAQIARVGNNINQIARQANTNNLATADMVVKALDLLEEIHSIIKSKDRTHGNSESKTNPYDTESRD